MIAFKRVVDLYYDEAGNLVACVSRRTDAIDPSNEYDHGVEFIPNGTGIQELLNEIVPGVKIEYADKPH